MSLRERLERMRRLGLLQPDAAAGAPAAGPSRGAAPGDAAPSGAAPAGSAPGGGAAASHAAAAVTALGLRGRATAHGDAYLAEAQIPADRPWGAACPGRLPDLPLQPLLRFAGVDARVGSAERILFLDTETTGLAGGAGTLVVVVGLGRLTGNHLQIRQLVLVDPAQEAAFLEVLAQEVAAADLLVSFNGRAFDWPLLEARCVLNRMAGLLPALPHLDLLHPARRLYAMDLASCRLAALESQVLGAERGFDIPGSEVPMRYRMLLDGHPQAFAEVLAHNRLDILSLAALTAHLADLTRRGLAEEDAPDAAGPQQLLALARACIRHGDGRRAERLLLAALARAGATRRGAAWFRVARTLADCYRRWGRWQEAAALWQEVADTYPPGAVWALVELAKEREHRARDLPAALAFTERALDLCRRRLLLGSPGARQDLAALEHRRRRLLRRLGRHNAPA